MDLPRQEFNKFLGFEITPVLAYLLCLGARFHLAGLWAVAPWKVRERREGGPDLIVLTHFCHAEWSKCRRTPLPRCRLINDPCRIPFQSVGSLLSF